MEQLELDQEQAVLAPRLLRLQNHLIDSLAISLVHNVLIYGLAYLGIVLSEVNSAVLALVFVFLYHFIFEASSQKTLGKIITRTHVVDEYGDPITTKAILIRTLCRLIPFEAISFISNGVGIHDTFSKSRVVMDQ